MSIISHSLGLWFSEAQSSLFRGWPDSGTLSAPDSEIVLIPHSSGVPERHSSINFQRKVDDAPNTM